MIEVAMGYHTLENYRALHDRIEALQREGQVVDVIYRRDPPAWLLNVSKVATDAGAAVVITIKGLDPEGAVAVMPFALFEKLVSRETGRA